MHGKLSKLFFSSIVGLMSLSYAVADVVVTTGVIVQETSMNVESLGAKFSSPKKWTASTYSGNTTAKYSLYETNLDKPVSSISWVKDLKVKYRTYNREKGDVKTSATTIKRVGQTDHVMIEISGTLTENYTEDQRLFAVRIDFGTSFYGVPIWYVFTQDPGYSHVYVTLDGNGGSPIAQYSICNYTTGKSYKQGTTMPYAVRNNYVFDAWYTRSDADKFNNIRIDETTLVSAAVTNIVAHWLLPQISNVIASQNNSKNISVSWNKSVHENVTYWLYRSEAESETGDLLVKTKRTTFDDITANNGVSYYYRVKAVNAETESLVSAEAEGIRCYADNSSDSCTALTITNVVVHYVATAQQSSAVTLATDSTGIVNVITEISSSGAIAVSSDWTEQYQPNFTSKFGSNFTKAVTAFTGKIDSAGSKMMVWQDYVAGTDPTDINDVFRASITFDKNTKKPVISWTPILSAEEAAKRVYLIYGKANLTDDWMLVNGNAENYNFFKVVVQMKSDL